MYIVPNMTLIPQDQTMSCWYASGQMIIHWRQEFTQSSEMAHPDPSEVARWQQLYGDNTGISNGKIMQFARDLGLQAVPPVCPTNEAIQSWLQMYGPLWVNGKTHITVIAGIRNVEGDADVLVYDPAKAGVTHGEWRNLRTWYELDGVSGRDESADVTAVFLYCPP